MIIYSRVRSDRKSEKISVCMLIWQEDYRDKFVNQSDFLIVMSITRIPGLLVWHLFNNPKMYWKQFIRLLMSFIQTRNSILLFPCCQLSRILYFLCFFFIFSTVAVALGALTAWHAILISRGETSIERHINNKEKKRVAKRGKVRVHFNWIEIKIIQPVFICPT